MNAEERRREKRKGKLMKVPEQTPIGQIIEHNKKILGEWAIKCIDAGSVRCYGCGSPSGVPGITLRKTIIKDEKTNEDKGVMMCVGCRNERGIK